MRAEKLNKVGNEIQDQQTIKREREMHVSDTFRLHDSTGGPAISVSADNLSRQEVEGGKTTKFFCNQDGDGFLGTRSKVNTEISWQRADRSPGWRKVIYFTIADVSLARCHFDLFCKLLFSNFRWNVFSDFRNCSRSTLFHELWNLQFSQQCIAMWAKKNSKIIPRCLKYGIVFCYSFPFLSALISRWIWFGL